MGRSSPEKESSPMSTLSERSVSGGSIPHAFHIAAIIARSRDEPSLRRSAGARFIMISASGSVLALFSLAAASLLFDSRTALSGSPTISKYGRFSEKEHSTVTI